MMQNIISQTKEKKESYTGFEQHGWATEKKTIFNVLLTVKEKTSEEIVHLIYDQKKNGHILRPYFYCPRLQ